MNESFFVSDSGTLTQPSEVAGWGADVPEQPRMGYEQRLCDKCGNPWGPTRCTQTGCNSIEFTVSYVEPIPLGRRLADLVRPKKAARATDAHRKALLNLQASAAALLVDLRVLDQQLRDAVRADVDELLPAQGVLHTALSISGDASPDRVAGLSLALIAFGASLNRAISHLEANPK
jgi:hypothetical protein